MGKNSHKFSSITLVFWHPAIQFGCSRILWSLKRNSANDLFINLQNFDVVSSVMLNPIALRKAKIVYNFGLSECNRVNFVC